MRKYRGIAGAISLALGAGIILSFLLSCRFLVAIEAALLIIAGVMLLAGKR